jgi:hypothetical protein
LSSLVNNFFTKNDTPATPSLVFSLDMTRRLTGQWVRKRIEKEQHYFGWARVGQLKQFRVKEMNGASTQSVLTNLYGA